MKPVELIEAKRKHLARLANQSGASGELAIIESMEHWLPRPKGAGIKVLLQTLKEAGISIKPSSFDAISFPGAQDIDFTNASVVAALLPSMVFIEIKTSNQERVKPDFTGFFFALTESEISAAEALGNRHKVAMYNKRTGELWLTSVPEILARAKSTNWQVSVQL